MFFHRSLLVGFVALVLSSWLGVASLGAAEGARVFRAGAATSNITPFLGVSINGGTQDRRAEHIHDELHARCLALDDGQTKLVLVVVDSCLVPREVFDEAKRLVHEATGLPKEAMLMSATHTHSAPSSASVFQSEADFEYRAFLSRRIADGVRRALNNLEPARIGWGVGHEPNHVHNRRWFVKSEGLLQNPFGGVDKVRMNPPRVPEELVKPSGPTDPEVVVLSLIATDGRPIAVYANYSLHYVGGVQGVSADYYGAFARILKARLSGTSQNPEFVAMMSNGTSGNINNNNYASAAVRRAPYEQIEIVANAVAQVAHQVIRQISYQDWVPLSVKQTELRLGVRKPKTEELARARTLVAQAKTAPRMTTREEIYARETLLMADYPEQVSLILQAMRIGDLGITAIPCETFVEIGLELKEKNPFKTSFTVSLANGYNGYLPTVQHHEWGGYETWRARSSYLEVQAAPKITATLFDLLKQVAR